MARSTPWDGMADAPHPHKHRALCDDILGLLECFCQFTPSPSTICNTRLWQVSRPVLPFLTERLGADSVVFGYLQTTFSFVQLVVRLLLLCAAGSILVSRLGLYLCLYLCRGWVYPRMDPSLCLLLGAAGSILVFLFPSFFCLAPRSILVVWAQFD